ncbi:MAG: hypothetical protein L7T19_03480, partial [Pseudomonadales bacterium]|nr:hypothetical protein [Pseudomonadales bacterium]
MPKGRNVISQSSNRFKAVEIIALLEAKNEPLTWHDLVQQVSADTPKAITQLRQMLKGLQRSGEIERDHQGAYHLPQAAEVVAVVIERQGRQLTAAGLPIEASKQLLL